MRQRAFVIILVMLMVVMGLTWFSLFSARQEMSMDGKLMGTLWPEPRTLSDFRMSDTRGGEFTPAALRGQWTLIFFGYTSCPDICPTTMLTLNRVTTAVQAAGGKKPSVVLVSVDPDRDDLQSLGEYVSYFDEEFLGVRGADRELQTLTSQIGVMYALDIADEDGNYEVAHSATIFLVDPEARIHAAFSPPHQPGDIVEKLDLIYTRYQRN
jgi:protein SCO1/2